MTGDNVLNRATHDTKENWVQLRAYFYVSIQAHCGRLCLFAWVEFQEKQADNNGKVKVLRFENVTGRNTGENIPGPGSQLRAALAGLRTNMSKHSSDNGRKCQASDDHYDGPLT